MSKRMRYKAGTFAQVREFLPARHEPRDPREALGEAARGQRRLRGNAEQLQLDPARRPLSAAGPRAEQLELGAAELSVNTSRWRSRPTLKSRFASRSYCGALRRPVIELALHAESEVGV